MTQLEKKARNKVREYSKDWEFLYLYIKKQEYLHGEGYCETWIYRAIKMRMKSIDFKKSLLKWLFNIR